MIEEQDLRMTNSRKETPLGVIHTLTLTHTSGKQVSGKHTGCADTMKRILLPNLQGMVL